MRNRALVVGEEKSLVPPDGASHGAAELIVLKGIFGLIRGVGEKVGRVHRAVSEKFKQRSMPVICAGLGLQIDHATRDVSEFGRVSSRLD